MLYCSSTPSIINVYEIKLYIIDQISLPDVCMYRTTTLLLVGYAIVFSSSPGQLIMVLLLRSVASEV